MRSIPINEKHNDKKRVLVLGGNGFIGREIVRQLENSSFEVSIGTRGLRSTSASNQHRLPLHQMTCQGDWIKALSGFDVVVNAVGILRERPGETYEDVHHKAVLALSRACETLPIKVIHISALGLNNNLKDPFSVSKKRGEQALIESHADWHIVRASLVEGEGAYGGSWFKRAAKWPVHFVPRSHACLAPVRVETLAEKVVQIIRNNNAHRTPEERIHEVSNGIKYLLPDYLVALNGGIKRPLVVVPDRLVKLVNWICDRLNLTPLSAGHRELLSMDNCPTQYVLPLYHSNGKDDVSENTIPPSSFPKSFDRESPERNHVI